MKLPVYRNAAVVAVCLGMLGLLLGCLEMSVSFEPRNSDTSSSSSPKSVVEKATPNTPIENSSRETTNAVFAYSPNSDSKAGDRGILRMSNQTDQPVRLALLARRSQVKSATSKQTNYDVPAHWDFAPQEGTQNGLLLSLPNGNLKLEKGDILVAFAQDGSRRYWGPYVVGETPVPAWNPEKKEWQLILSQ
ncbi:MAG: hypothetical protein ACHBN1_21355 [Heteroscytonema crispum UTEX LB 1556]